MVGANRGLRGAMIIMCVFGRGKLWLLVLREVLGMSFLIYQLAYDSCGRRSHPSAPNGFPHTVDLRGLSQLIRDAQ